MRLLVLAVIRQAIWDLHSPDKLKRLDAYLFLLDDVPTWLDELGIDFDPPSWCKWVDSGCPRHAKAARARVKSRPQVLGVKFGSLVSS